MAKAKIRDIYDCEAFNVWRDGEWIYFTIHHNGCSLVLCPEAWEDLKKNFRKMLTKGNVVEIAGRKDGG